MAHGTDIAGNFFFLLRKLRRTPCARFFSEFTRQCFQSRDMTMGGWAPKLNFFAFSGMGECPAQALTRSMNLWRHRIFGKLIVLPVFAKIVLGPIINRINPHHGPFASVVIWLRFGVSCANSRLITTYASQKHNALFSTIGYVSIFKRTERAFLQSSIGYSVKRRAGESVVSNKGFIRVLRLRMPFIQLDTHISARFAHMYSCFFDADSSVAMSSIVHPAISMGQIQKSKRIVTARKQ